MVNTKSDNIDERNFIDKYDNILDLKKGQTVMSKMPKLSLQNHK